MEKCRVCEEPTKVYFNINLKAVPICESCATSIAMQQVSWWGTQN